jgi:putative membrane protein
LFYLRVRLSLGRAQRKIKRLELQIEPVAVVTPPAASYDVSKE